MSDKSRIYTLIVDSELDSKLAMLENQFAEGEHIVSQSTVPMPNGTTKLVITTREVRNKNKNLLLEELQSK